MNNQLSNIAVQYRKFSKGQYIEHPQFNEFLDFFEDQDRLSRVLLQGVGIVCGLKPDLIYTNKLLSGIQLSQGVAITTDGDLLTLNNTNEVSKDLYVSDLKTIKIESKKYTYFKKYDNFKVNYPAFYYGKDNQIELWELATDEEANSGFQSISNLSNLEDKYLLLYLEDYEKEVKPCRGVDCDNHGIQQIRNLKVLVTTANGINYILGKDKVQPHPLFVDDILGPVKQERVIVEQLILENDIDTPFSFTDLRGLYIKALDKNKYGEALFQKINTISQFMGASGVNYSVFKNTLNKFLAKESGFQYAYDVVKDLADTYSEIIKLLPKAFTKCLPDVVSFPKHIMLGKLLSDTELDFSRHQFYNSPVLDDEKTTQRVKVLINRFNQQVLSFKYPDIVEIGVNSKIKITPSQKLNPLNNKAVPFYYELSVELLKAWNFDKTSNRSFRDNLAYDTGLALNAHIQDPLSFNIDKNSFYNIEGHQGLDYQIAFDQIKEIRDKQQLGFDIMLVSLDELKDNKDLVKAYFNEYVEKHPGLEHRRGVQRGGTFVIVYQNIGRDNRVVADFSLPYICCTPKNKIELSLPTTTICVESRPIPFKVIPANGEVKANVSANVKGGVELIGTQYFFNPKKVDLSLLDKEITFTVNGKPTNCSIKVISQPNIKVEVVEPVIYSGGDSKTTIVNFKVSGQNFANYTYSWDFLGNDFWAPLNPDKNGYVSYKYSNLDPKNIPVVRVKVSGGGCSETIPVNLPQTKECPVISNIKYIILDNGNGTQTFTFDWDLPSDLSGITGLNIYDSSDLANGWHYESGSYRPRRTITLPLGKYSIRFGLVGSCKNPENTLELPGFNDIGIMKDQNNHPPVVSIKWNDILGNGDRVCILPTCSYAIDIYANDEDGDLASVQIQKSTNNGTTWSLFTGNFNGTTFTDSISGLGTNLYRVVVIDGKNNTATSNILSYKNEYRPTVVIESIDFPANGNCCTAVSPTIIAKVEGPDRVPLSSREFGLKGLADGALDPLYFWSKLTGPDVILIGTETSDLIIRNISFGQYEFRLLVKDRNSDAFGIAVAKVDVFYDQS